MRITVVIPTCRRTALLKSALASVANQSRRDLIEEVIVSENSDDGSSSAVAAQFPNLPIRYIHQTPAMAAGDHFAYLPTIARTEWTAPLADDDMWGRYHLESAYRALTAHPEAVAFVGQSTTTSNESRTSTGVTSYLLAANTSERNCTLSEYWLLNELTMTVECLAYTPLNMWALVGRTDSLRKVFHTAFTEPGAGHDSDRYLLWALGKLGAIVAGREITLFYRTHDDNACARLLREDAPHQYRMSKEYTERMMRDAARTGRDLKTAWRDAIAATPLPERVKYWQNANPGAKAAILEAWGKDLRDLGLTPPITLKRIWAAATPPGVNVAMLWFRRMMNARQAAIRETR